jgi:hypothetical protein
VAELLNGVAGGGSAASITGSDWLPSRSRRPRPPPSQQPVDLLRLLNRGRGANARTIPLSPPWTTMGAREASPDRLLHSVRMPRISWMRFRLVSFAFFLQFVLQCIQIFCSVLFFLKNLIDSALSQYKRWRDRSLLLYVTTITPVRLVCCRHVFQIHIVSIRFVGR